MKRAVPSGVFDVLDAALARDSNAPALVTPSARLSYGELDALADRAVGALVELGVRPGERVGVSLPNDVGIVAAFHGAMRLGAIWVGVNRALARPEKAFMLRDCGASVVLADDDVAPDFEGGDEGWRVVRPGEWAAAMDGSGGLPELPRPDPLAPAAIAYTSGTTGFPKGAVHCQAALVMPGAGTVLRRGWGRELRKGDSLPLTILNMFTLTTLLTAQSGGVAVLTDMADVASIAEWIGREQVTVWNAVPAQLHTMAGDESISAGHLAGLGEVWVGGADCPDALRDRFEARFGVKVIRTYGLTESPALVSIDDLEGDRPSGSSGRPLDHIEVASVDGELRLRPAGSGPLAGSYRPMLGYWNQPEATAAAVSGRELRTGDLGEIDDGGHVRVLGRKSQLIIRGGANVYPAEVERVLAGAPGVAACAVVGVPDERLGERVGAAIEVRPGASVDEDEIVAYCRENLARYKVPERFVYVDKLPRNQMGKVPRPEVVEMLVKAAAR